MTVTTTSTKVQYNGDGSTTAFSVPFKYLSKDDVKVILTDADGDDTEWTRGTQYTLSAAGVDAGGTLTVSTSPTNYTPQAGERLTILLDAEATQNVDLPLGGPFPSPSVESALDRLTLLVQQREEENARSLRFPESDPTTIDGTIPSSANRANMVLGFNGDGEPTVYTTNVETVTASSTNYDNAASGLAAINVQDAIDELADEKFDKTGGAVSGDVSVTGAVSATTSISAGTSISAASLAGNWIATQAEAEAGSNNDQVMTPLRTAQAIAALASGAFESALLHVRDEKTSGTHGGSAIGGTWHTRDLNTIEVNEIGAAVAGNQITLDAGTYFVLAAGVGYGVNGLRSRFRNVTDGSTVAVGETAYAGSGGFGATCCGRFTIAASKTFELQTWTQATRTSNGLGNATSTGEVEVYSEVLIWKVA